MYGLDVVAEYLKVVEDLLGLHPDWTYLSKVPTWMWIAVPTAFTYYKYITWNFDTFKKLGIPGPIPWPFLGTMYQMVKKGMWTYDLELHKKYGKVVGTFNGSMPVLHIHDVDILKQIMIKEFPSFTNRFIPAINDYPMSSMLHMLKGDHWKHVRNILTPTFSSGKLRKMDGKIEKCAQTLLANLAEKARTGETFDLRDLCGAYTMDVIASTAFSVQIDSHNDPNNQFVRMAKKAFTFSITSPLVLLVFLFPAALKPLSKIGVTLFPKDALKFFMDVTNEALNERQQDEQNQKQTDFLQIMVNAHIDDEDSKQSKIGKTQSGKEKVGLTHEEVLAQALLFFLAGFDTTANTLSLFGYDLATNPDCQDKLIAEIDQVMKDHDHVDYDVLKKMPYLEMCLNESQRLHPAAVRTDRTANADCIINGLLIPKGMTIVSPIYALHMNPEVWPNPTKYIPERFTAEEKAARNPYYFMPFGVGPRNCVGMRLARTELKMSIVKILQQFKFVTCPDTQIPLVYDKMAMRGANGIKLRMEKRVKYEDMYRHSSLPPGDSQVPSYVAD